MTIRPTTVALAAQAVAQEVADELGAPRIPANRYVTVSPTAIRETATAYALLPRLRTSDLHAWDAMASEVDHQYRALERAGFELVVSEANPYDRAADLFAAVADRRLHVLSTAATGGHPYWSDEQNDRFRAVHDLFGHCRTARGFNSHGEEAAFQSHVTMFSSQAALAMATETRGQNHAMMADPARNFAAERIAILPAPIRALEHGWARQGEDLTAVAESFDVRTGIAERA